MTSETDSVALPRPSLGPAPRDHTEPGATRHREGLSHAIVASWLALAVVYGTWPLARFAGSRVPSNLGDPLEMAWIFGWAAHALVHQPLHLFESNMFWPEHHTLAYSENHLGAAIPASPVFWLTGNAVLTAAIATLALLVLGGFGVYRLVHAVGGSRGAGVVAGTAFALLPYRVEAAASGHIHVVSVYLTPFVLLVLLRLRERRTLRRLAGLALLVALQWWTSLTGGVICLVAVGTWGVWELARLRRRAWPLLWPATLACALGLVLSLPVLLPYFEVRRGHPEFTHPAGEVVIGSARPGSYLSPSPSGPALRSTYARLSRRFRDPEVASEKELFGGFWLLAAFAGALAVGGRALFRSRDGNSGGRPQAEAIGLFSTMAFVAFVLSLGPRWGARPSGFVLPFSALQTFIPGNLIRVPARLGVLALLGATVAAGVALAGIRSSRLRALVVAGSLLLIGLEVMPPRLQLVAVPEPTAAHRAMADRSGAFLGLPTIEFKPEGVTGIDRDPLHMYLGTVNFRPLANGYGAFYPQGFLDLARVVTDLPSPGAFAALRTRGVATVVVEEDLLAGTAWDGVSGRLEHWPGVRRLRSTPRTSVFDVSGAR